MELSVKASNQSWVARIRNIYYTYDNNGNLTDDGINTYTWTYRNELESVDNGSLVTTYVYDEHGNRFSKSDSAGDRTFYIGDYVYDESDDSEELHLSIAGVPVAMLERDSTGAESVNYLHTDHLGSISVMTDSSGNWTVSRDY